MAELGVGIEADLGVEDEQLAVVGDGERIDLDLRGVGADEGLEEQLRYLLRLLRQIAVEAEREGDGAAVMRHEAGGRIDGEGMDLFGRVVGHFLDVHAALGRDDESDAAGLPVDEQGEIEFLRDVDAVGHVEPVDLLAGRPGLDGDQGIAEHLGGGGTHFVGRMGEADAALRVGPELPEPALAAAAGMDLRLHHVKRSGQLVGRSDGFIDAHGGKTGRNRHTELRQQFLGLIFVDVHR